MPQLPEAMALLRRHHIHMNSTKWYTLTEFVQHLSKTGQVRADLTDKGWFISVIQPDPEEKLAEERRHKRDRAERVSIATCDVTMYTLIRCCHRYAERNECGLDFTSI